MSKKNDKQRPFPNSLGLPLSGADAHAHLDSRGLLEDLPAVMERAHKAGISHIAQVFCRLEDYFAHRNAICPEAWNNASAPWPEIVFCLGVHPNDVGEFNGSSLNALAEAFREDGRLRALGEIGLDFYHKTCSPPVQEEAFRVQLRLARRLDLPVVIHSRDAAVETLRVLEEEGFVGRPLLWHCFSGDAVPYAARITGNGWHVSIPGPASYPANTDLRAAIATLPADRLLIETDCPYLAPEPWRGKRNEPALAAFTGLAVAEARGLAPAALWTMCGENMRRFFGV